MNPETTQENPVKTADQQLADIKAQTAKIVQSAQKLDPAIKVSQADAEMIGLPKLRVPTQTANRPVAPELSRVGTTQIPATGTDKAREALLSQVPEADRDTISAILDASMGLETARGTQLEGDLESLSSERLRLAQDKKNRVLDRKELEGQFDTFSMQAELESIKEEADALSAQRNIAIQNEAAREGTSTQAQNQNINAIEKDFNLQRANLAIRELASVRKMNAATRAIEAKLDIKYGDIEAETELVKAQIDSILPLLSREDAKVAEQRQLLNDVARTTIADARESDKQLEEFKLNSYINAQQNGATPAVLGMIMSSDSREDVASVGGSFIQDPMQKLQMRQGEASIRASDASTANSYDAIAQRAEQNKLLLGTLDGKAQTEGQRLTEVFATRMLESNSVINDVGGKFTGTRSRFAAFTPNELLSEDRQKFDQAQRNFINASLRRESGAVISPEEFVNARLQYFPQPGDSPGVLAQKKQNRDTQTVGFFSASNVPMPELQQVDAVTPLQTGYKGVTTSGLTYTIE